MVYVTKYEEAPSVYQAILPFYIAKGSLAELSTQLEIAYEIAYLEKRVYSELETMCDEIGRMGKADQGEAAIIASHL
jgi:four helix bundle protein